MPIEFEDGLLLGNEDLEEDRQVKEVEKNRRKTDSWHWGLRKKSKEGSKSFEGKI